MAIKIGKLLSANTMVGTSDDDTLIGGLFNDVFIGGAGKDYMDGGLGGSDTVDYSASSEGVIVDLAAGRGWLGDAEGDAYRSIENAIGSAFADYLIGNAGNNTMTGGKGADIFGMTGGKDVITDFKPVSPDTVIDFNDLPPVFAPSSGIVTNGYQGLNWGNVHYLNAVGKPSGYDNLGLGTAVAFDAASNGGTITTAGADFTLKSAYMAASFNDNLQVTIEGWDDGVLKVTKTFTLGVDRTLVAFVGFDSIDKVTFDGVGGTNHGYSGGGTHVVWDDVRLVFEDGGDRIDVPETTNIDALIASAVSDGKGGTLLSLPAVTYVGRDGKTYTSSPASSLDLVGVDPNSVSADWFV